MPTSARSRESAKPAAKKPAAAKKPVAAKKPAAAKKTVAAKKAAAAKKPAAIVPKAGPVGPKAAAVGSEAAYQRYLPLAQKIPASEVLSYRLDPVLAHHNAQLALVALSPHKDALKKALPLLDHAALFDVAELAQAVVFADLSVEGKVRSLGETRTLLSEASQLRALLLGTAEALALAGVWKSQAVDKIRSGSGPIDLAQDCIELAALFGKSDLALSAQKLVRAEHLQRASELGTLLLGRLQPGSARKKGAARNDAAQVAARDRLATLLWQRYRDVRRAAYYLWGDALDAHVPALQTRRRSRPSSAKSPKSPSAPIAP